MNISNKLTANLKTCIKKAGALAKKNKETLRLSHFLITLFSQKGSLAHDLLVQNKVNLVELKKTLTDPKILKTKDVKSKITSLEQLLIKSFNLAHKQEHSFVGTEHCLATLIADPPYILKYIFKTHKINTDKLKKQINFIMNGNSKIPELTDFSAKNLNEQFMGGDPEARNQNFDLQSFSTNLTDYDFQKNINPIISRDAELNRMIQILSRKDKNNPIILGDPGVGKTALVEGLAKNIIEGNVPNILKDKIIISLDLGAILAGTMYRGDFENRLKGIIDEVKNNPHIIIFIDEIHNIMGTGASQGTMDAANILKPLLARGQLRCIGATTMEEFKKFIEKDPALERRFQPIIVSEPSKEETMDIMHGIKKNYEKYHQVKFEDNAIHTAVHLSSRYIQDKLLPDKAIDLIDEAAAKTKIANSNSAIFSEIKTLENHLYKTIADKEKAVHEENYNQAIKLKSKEKELNKQLDDLTNLTNKNLEANPPLITEQDIINLLAEKTKIPIQELTFGDSSQLATLKDDLAEHVIGQEQALEEITMMIKRAKLGLSDENRPLTSLLLLGPSGVGKTFTAKILAKTLFHDSDAFIRIDMSEFSDKFHASKLIGAPAGYVGYREPNKLTDAVKKRPYSLVLFDEIEKAHPDVINLLLQVLEDGHLTDSSGKKINFKNTAIVMTSNIGSDLFHKGKLLGFGDANNAHELKQNINNETKKIFRPEFVSRINKIVHFNKLEPQHLKQIIQSELKIRKEKLQKRGFTINISAKKINELTELCFKLENGARGVNQIIEEHFETPLINQILKDKNKKIVIN